MRDDIVITWIYTKLLINLSIKKNTYSVLKDKNLIKPQ